MGVDYVLFERICELSGRFRPEGRSLMLGRQSFRLEGGKIERKYANALKRHGIAADVASLQREDGFSEALWAGLGFGEMESMDFSKYEGAGIVHDLNKPVPPELLGQFGFIFDGGTLEHVFNVPQALDNVFHMLRPGGRFVSANGMNGWVGHGLYQFSPELAWTYWGRTMGCKVHACLGIKKMPLRGGEPLVFPDPADSGKRLRLKGLIPEGRVYLYYEVERLPTSAAGDIVLQSDYETLWHPHTNAGETRLDRQES